MERTERIRELNDLLRKHFSTAPHLVPGPFRITITQGVGALDQDMFADLVERVAAFAAFTEGSDPHAEHDFGAVPLGLERYFWKIDYYDSSLQLGSPDPADPAVTVRVLTIMRADEY